MTNMHDYSLAHSLTMGTEYEEISTNQNLNIYKTVTDERILRCEYS